MDFFERQDQAQRRTHRLVFYFAVAVFLIIVAIYVLLVFILGILDGDLEGANAYLDNPWHPDLFLIVALGTCLVVGAGSAYKISQLSHGGEAVAAMLGGRRLNPQSTDLAERRLLNVVEEMALASGVPVPPVYVMDKEQSINAFAAGYSPGDAVIGVSGGCLTYLNRDELQGVMAHEFSHILNGDMRLNTRLTGVLHGIVIIALIGWILIRMVGSSRPRSSRDSKGSGGIIIAVLAVGAGLLVIGGIGSLFARIIRAAVSRQREHLADASAVQFTRNPGGIAGALKKIGGVPATSKIENDHGSEISHMFFCSAAGSFASRVFATHPPLAERIRSIDPTFNGEFPKNVEPVRADEPRKSPAAKPRDPLGKVGETLDPAGVFGRFGTTGGQQVILAAALLEEMPDPLRAAAHEPYGARALVYCLLLDGNAEVRAKQMATLERNAEAPSFEETKKLLPMVDRLPDDARLPLVELSFPALKHLSPEQYDRFTANCTALIEADGRLDLLEYTIRAMVLDQLDVHFGRRAAPKVRYTQLSSVASPAVQVLSTLAYVGSSDPNEVADAYSKGLAVLRRKESQLPAAQCNLGQLDKSLKTLAECSPLIKRQVLQACTATVAADNKVIPRERQLLHAIAAVLGVPMGL
ncbi:MAG: M48 family metallopeptidase [Thermoguttaceae bacterium]|jgi:Zn-dependent protease with chaperone function|nr:M48 family metallopeptidase [Thermoguttaceae bacterium]